MLARPRPRRHHHHPHDAVPRGSRPHGRRHRRARPRRTVAHGTPDELKARIGDDRIDVKVAASSELVAAASALSAFADNDPTFDSEALIVTAPLKPGVRVIDVVRALDEAGIDAVDITRREATLDEVFLALTSARPTSQEVTRHEQHLVDRQHDLRSPQPRAHPPDPREAAQRHHPADDVRVAVRVRLRRRDHVDGGGYKEYLIGGILIQTLAFGMMGPAMSIATDLQEGVIDRFRSLPARRSAYLLGHYFAEMLGSILTIVILLGTGLHRRLAHPHRRSSHVLEALALLLVFASAIIWLGLWFGILVRSPDAVMGIGFVIIFPVTFISNAFVPIESMPNMLQWVASVNPVSVLIAAVRTLFGNPVSPVTKHVWPIDNPVAAAWIYSVALVAARLGHRPAPLQGPHHRLTHSEPRGSGVRRGGAVGGLVQPHW